LVGRSKRPCSGGIAGEAGEIPAGARTLEELADDIARGVDEHTHRDIYVAANLAQYDSRYVWDLLVKHGVGSERSSGRAG
jgi:hypothetical protein